jgi:Flp pilus assembly protein TadB
VFLPGERRTDVRSYLGDTVRYRPAFLVSVAIVGVAYGIVAPLLPNTMWRIVALAVGVLVVIVVTWLGEHNLRNTQSTSTTRPSAPTWNPGH